MNFDPYALAAGISGLGGMLIGGLITYHQVSIKMVELEEKIKTINGRLDLCTDKFISKTLCDTTRKACETHMEQQDARMDRIDAQFTEVFRKLDVIRDILANKADR